jgi:phage repressor protein C with HTH and peptisase S24 domain
MENILDRIGLIADNEDIKITALEREIGASKGVLSRAISNGTDIQSKWLQKIVENYPNYSTEWLITGRGEMLKETVSNEITKIYKLTKHMEKIIESQDVTLYDVSAAANLKTLFVQKDQNILGKITLPNIPKCDGAMYVTGDSMDPIIKSGDIVCYKEIHDFNNIIYGEMYIVSIDMEGDEYLSVKH